MLNWLELLINDATVLVTGIFEPVRFHNKALPPEIFGLFLSATDKYTPSFCCSEVEMKLHKTPLETCVFAGGSNAHRTVGGD